MVAALLIAPGRSAAFTPPTKNTGQTALNPSYIIRFMKWWIYRRPFTFEGQAYLVRVLFDGGCMCTDLFCGGEREAHDESRFLLPDGQRNHQLSVTLADGRRLSVTAGYVSYWSFAIRVECEGQVVHESHPGRRIAWPGAPTNPADVERVRRESAMQRERWALSKHSVGVDAALGVLFYIVAKFTDLTTAALVSVAAGLLVFVAQRFVKVDLLGGLAVFGLVMLLVSAGFSLALQDEWAVKMKSTFLGLLVAGLMLSDGALNSGRYFGQRLGNYLMHPTHPGRLAWGMGMAGLVMAGLNWGVATYAATEDWLVYSTFVDVFVAAAMFMGVVRFARLPSD